MAKDFEATYRKALLDHGYEFRGTIGRGGMSRVDEVRHRATGQAYAVKHLGPHTPDDKRDRYRRVLRREGEYQFDHPNVMRVLETFEAGKNCFLVMPRMRSNLKHLIEGQRKFPLNFLIDIVHQAAAGLIYLHQQGVVHRDLKPSNALYNWNGRDLHVVLCDFGLSLDSWAQLARAFKRTIRAHVAKAGTPTYASPEQMRRGGRCDRRSDIYSLGRIMDTLFGEAMEPTYEIPKTPQQRRRLRHLEKGIYLYKRETAAVMEGRIAKCLPYELQQLVLECIQKEPDRRLQDVSAVYYALSKILMRHRTSQASGSILSATTSASTAAK